MSSFASGPSGVGEVVGPTIAALPVSVRVDDNRQDITPPRELVCPITLSLFANPILAPDGFTYEKRVFEEWIKGQRLENGAFRSPVTGEVVEGGRGFENKVIKGLCEAWREKIDEEIRDTAAMSKILSLRSSADLEERFLPLFEVGGGRGGGRCRDGNGVGFNLVASGVVEPSLVKRVAEASAEAFENGGRAGEGPIGGGQAATQ